MIWNSDALLAKATTYFARAYTAERNSALFGTWMGLGVEHLARAALASVHPVLLADPQDGKNLLYAFGVETKLPRSIPMKTVVTRCEALFENFTEEHGRGLLAVTELRNTELHSGASPFEGISTDSWYVPLLRAITVLVTPLGVDLASVVGTEEAAIAATKLAEASNELKSEVLKAVAHHAAIAEQLGVDDRLKLMNARQRIDLPAGWSRREDACPACGERIAIGGYLVKEFPTELLNDELIERSMFMPARASCPICGLDLRGHEALMIAGLGELFTEQVVSDAEEHFGMRYEERYADYSDYGND